MSPGLQIQKSEIEKDGSIHVKVHGSMSICEAMVLRNELLGCLQNGSALELDLEAVTDCDVAGLQLLYAARRSAAEGNKRFGICAASQTILETLRRVGLNPDEILNPE